MAAVLFPGQVTAVQVGTYFVGQYYQILQQQPSMVHQFYNDSSTMTRIDGAKADNATGMLQIHYLIMSLNYSGIEIRSAHSTESWGGGVLVVVTGLMQTKDYAARRTFSETFFLAPQEKGYFVLNDIFHFLEDEQIHQLPAMQVQTNYVTKMVATNPTPEPVVPDYNLREEVSSRNFSATGPVEENDTIDKYSVPEPSQTLPETAEKLDETPVEEPVASYTKTSSVVRDPPPVYVDEPVGEPAKHTYASILRVTKALPVPHSAPSLKTAQDSSEWQFAQQSAPQQCQTASTFGPEKSSAEVPEESAVVEDEGEPRSVYVGNLPSSITVPELEQEFKNFGRIRPEGVTIRSRKETGAFYAFVEFDDATGVQNALKASPLDLNGRLIHIEGRRPNINSFRGRRGRGRGGYQFDGPRGRFGGRNYGRGNGGQENNARDYRPRGNGYVQRARHQERGILGNHNQQWGGQNPEEA